MKGLIHLYCGEGKGKTTAAMGLALRAAGAGKRVVVLQFLKDGKSAELGVLRKAAGVEVVPQTRTFGFSWTLSPEEKEEARRYYTGLLAQAIARGGDCDVLVLDEAVGAIAAGFIDEAQLLSFLAGKPEGLEVVLTGRDPSQALVDQADYVTEMRKIKHPFDRGIPARPGVEY